MVSFNWEFKKVVAPPLLSQLLTLWFTEFGVRPIRVKDILAKASKPLMILLRRIAPDANDPSVVDACRLGAWIGEHKGVEAAGWKLMSRERHRQNEWWIAEVMAGRSPSDILSDAHKPAPVPPAPESMFEKKSNHEQLSPAEKLGRNLARRSMSMRRSWRWVWTRTI
jgi:hypothetical protein